MSSAGNINSSASHPSTSASPSSELSKGVAPKEKKKVTFAIDGSAVGTNSGRWNTRTGDLVRAYIPISIIDYKKVTETLKMMFGMR